MLTRTIAIVMLCASTCHAQNFVGDRDLVAAAERARIRSAEFWTGKKLKDWDEPCQISWSRGGESLDSGSTKFSYSASGVSSMVMSVSGPRELAISNALPHEVDHAVRHSIIGKPIPRWLDEGCAAQFESREAKKRIRSALIHGNLRASVWDMFGDKEYPQDADSLTALYSGSASLVEWMLEMSSPRDLMRAQEAGMDSHQKWKLYVGEDASISRRRYEKWFAAKYGSGNPEPAIPSKDYIDVWVAGDFHCPPCESFKKYARSTTARRGFDYHLHPISHKDCVERGISVPLFVANNISFDGPVNTWEDVDNWARKQLQVNQKTTPPPPAENDPLPVREPQLGLPPIPDSRPVSVSPGITATPEAIRVIGDMLDPRPEPKKEVVINWEGLTILVAISDEFPALAMAGEGPGRRAIQRLTGGKSKITIISERAEPSLFDSYQKALGLDVKKFHISILVPESILSKDVEAAVNKIEVIFNNNVSNFAEERPGDIPVEIISELISPLDYSLVNKVLSNPAEKSNKGDGFVGNDTIQKSLLGTALAAALGVAFYYYRRKPVEPVS